MIEKEKPARLIDNKLFNLREKPRKKTEKSFEKRVDKKVVNEKPSCSVLVKNLVIQ